MIPHAKEYILHEVSSPESCPLYDTAAALPDSLNRLQHLSPATTADIIFGPYSSLATETLTPQTFIYQYSTAFQAIVLLMLLVYAIIILRFRHQTGALLRSAWASNHTDLNNDYDMSDLNFRAMILLCDVLMWGTLAAWGVRLWNLPQNRPLLTAPNDWSVTLIFAVTAAGIILLRRSAMFAAGTLTLSQDFVKHLNFKHFALSVSSVTFTVPLLLSGILVVGQWKYFAFATTLLILLANAGIYICKSFYLFVKQKISILVWILYLCSVELIPITIVVLTAIRNWSI